MSTGITDAQGRELIAPDAELELLRSGFSFTEGPVWERAGDYLVFSDIPGDELWRWDERDGFVSYRRPSHRANGNTLDLQGRLLTCEHATSRLTRVEKDGSTTVLASTYEGKQLNSPNDVVVAADGSIYFTDPTYGRTESVGVERPTDLDFQGVYRLDGDGGLHLLVDDFTQPNGLCFSLDERILYINDSELGLIRRFTRHDDGSLSGGEVWAQPAGDERGGPDGMKLDALGNVFCCGPGGLHAFSPDGALLGVLRIPEVVGNFVWGGTDYRTLFVCASTGVYRIRTVVAGNPPVKTA